MSAKKRDEREPLDITWNAIPGKRCALCGQDFLDDGSIDVEAALADHMANVHPATQSSLLTNRQATVSPEPESASVADAKTAKKEAE